MLRIFSLQGLRQKHKGGHASRASTPFNPPRRWKKLPQPTHCQPPPRTMLRTTHQSLCQGISSEAASSRRTEHQHPVGHTCSSSDQPWSGAASPLPCTEQMLLSVAASFSLDRLRGAVVGVPEDLASNEWSASNSRLLQQGSRRCSCGCLGGEPAAWYG